MAETTASLQTYLSKLYEARQSLTLGDMEVQISSVGGRTVIYKQTDLQTINREIARVERALGVGTGNRPITPFF